MTERLRSQHPEDKNREIKMCHLNMPQWEDAHLEPELAEGNFHLFSKSLFLFHKLHSDGSVDERKDTWSSRRSDQYPAGFCNTRGQRVEQLIGGKPKITCSLSWNPWPRHSHSTWLNRSNINKYRHQNWAKLDFQFFSLFSFIHFTFWF